MRKYIILPFNQYRKECGENLVAAATAVTTTVPHNSAESPDLQAEMHANQSRSTPQTDIIESGHTLDTESRRNTSTNTESVTSDIDKNLCSIDSVKSSIPYAGSADTQVASKSVEKKKTVINSSTVNEKTSATAERDLGNNKSDTEGDQIKVKALKKRKNKSSEDSDNGVTPSKSIKKPASKYWLRPN